jgi:hypothetical protein
MIIARRSWKPTVGKGEGSQVILLAFADRKNNRADPAVVRRRSGFDLPPATCAHLGLHSTGSWETDPNRKVLLRTDRIINRKRKSE